VKSVCIQAFFSVQKIQVKTFPESGGKQAHVERNSNFLMKKPEPVKQYRRWIVLQQRVKKPATPCPSLFVIQLSFFHHHPVSNEKING
jgi:hypothetical protein